MTENIIEIIEKNFNEFKGSNEAILHASEEIADIIEEKQGQINIYSAKLKDVQKSADNCKNIIEQLTSLIADKDFKAVKKEYELRQQVAQQLLTINSLVEKVESQHNQICELVKENDSYSQAQVFKRENLNPEFLKIIDGIDKNLNNGRK